MASGAVSWIMVASAFWSLLVTLLMLMLSFGWRTSGIEGTDGVVVIEDTTFSPDWPYVAIAFIACLGSIAAVVLLKRVDLRRSRIALSVVILTGIMGLLSAVAAIISAWITRTSE